MIKLEVLALHIESVPSGDVVARFNVGQNHWVDEHGAELHREIVQQVQLVAVGRSSILNIPSVKGTRTMHVKLTASFI